MDSDQNRPQADGANPPPAGFAPDQGQDYAGEHDFAGFQPDVRESLLPRWLHLSLIGLLGLGAAAALVMAGMFVTQERKTDKTLELLAASSRGELAAPAVPVAATVGEKKARDLVLLPSPTTAAEPRADASPAPVPQGSVPATPVAAHDPPIVPAASANADAAPVTSAAPAKTKPIARKKRTRTRQATALAQQDDSQPWRGDRGESQALRDERAETESRQRERGESQASQSARSEAQSSQRAQGDGRTWPRRRGDSITEKLNAAVAACRARPHAPGECNLRACDILGSSDPACR